MSGAELHILRTGHTPCRESPPPVAERPALDEDEPTVTTQAPVFEPGCEVSTYPDAPCDMELPPMLKSCDLRDRIETPPLPPGVLAAIQERERRRAERLASLDAHIAQEAEKPPPVTNYTLFSQSCRTTFAIWKMFWKIMWGLK